MRLQTMITHIELFLAYTSLSFRLSSNAYCIDLTLFAVCVMFMGATNTNDSPLFSGAAH